MPGAARLSSYRLAAFCSDYCTPPPPASVAFYRRSIACFQDHQWHCAACRYAAARRADTPCRPSVHSRARCADTRTRGVGSPTSSSSSASSSCSPARQTTSRSVQPFFSFETSPSRIINWNCGLMEDCNRKLRTHHLTHHRGMSLDRCVSGCCGRTRG